MPGPSQPNVLFITVDSASENKSKCIFFFVVKVDLCKIYEKLSLSKDKVVHVLYNSYDFFLLKINEKLEKLREN
jgi:hypothetical protein